jgi:hypothetical protein
MTEHAVVIAGGGPTGLNWRASWRWRGSTSPLSSGAPARTSRARAQAVCIHGQSRCSINVVADRFLTQGRTIRREDVGLDIHYDLGEGHPLLGRRMPDLDLIDRQRPAAGLQPPARCPAGAPQPRRARRLRHRSVGRSGSADRRRVRWYVGASGTGGGRRSHRRVDSARDTWPGWET